MDLRYIVIRRFGYGLRFSILLHTQPARKRHNINTPRHIRTIRTSFAAAAAASFHFVLYNNIVKRIIGTSTSNF